MGLARLTAAMLDFIADRVTHRAPVATLESVQIVWRSKALLNEQARQELGYAPRPIEQALRKTVASIGDKYL